MRENKSGKSIAVELWKKNAAFAAGTAEIGIGLYAAAAAVAPLFLACVGAGLLASGIGSLFYAIKTPEEQVSMKDFISQSTISFLGGAVGRCIGRVVSSVAAPVAAAALSSMTEAIASTTTEAAIKRNVKMVDITRSVLFSLLTKGVFEEGKTELMVDLFLKLEGSKNEENRHRPPSV